MSTVGYDFGGALAAAAVRTSCVLRGLPTKAAADGSADSNNKQQLSPFMINIIYLSPTTNNTTFISFKMIISEKACCATNFNITRKRAATDTCPKFSSLDRVLIIESARMEATKVQ